MFTSVFDTASGNSPGAPLSHSCLGGFMLLLLPGFALVMVMSPSLEYKPKVMPKKGIHRELSP